MEPVQGKTKLIETKLISTVPSNTKPEATQSVVTSTVDAALFAIPICFLLIWAAIIATVLDFPKITPNRKPFLKSLRPFPCRNCQFFSSNPYLKCAIHPSTAMTEQSIDCNDYHPNNPQKKPF